MRLDGRRTDYPARQSKHTGSSSPSPPCRMSIGWADPKIQSSLLPSPLSCLIHPSVRVRVRCLQVHRLAAHYERERRRRNFLENWAEEKLVFVVSFLPSCPLSFIPPSISRVVIGGITLVFVKLGDGRRTRIVVEIAEYEAATWFREIWHPDPLCRRRRFGCLRPTLMTTVPPPLLYRRRRRRDVNSFHVAAATAQKKPTGMNRRFGHFGFKLSVGYVSESNSGVENHLYSFCVCVLGTGYVPLPTYTHTATPTSNRSACLSPAAAAAAAAGLLFPNPL